MLVAQVPARRQLSVVLSCSRLAGQSLVYSASLCIRDRELAMSKTAIKVGPEDHGRRMRLEEFDHCEEQEGYLYELRRGVIAVSDVPRPRDRRQVDGANRQFFAYQFAHPDRLYIITSVNECNLL